MERDGESDSSLCSSECEKGIELPKKKRDNNVRFKSHSDELISEDNFAQHQMLFIIRFLLKINQIGEAVER